MNLEEKGGFIISKLIKNQIIKVLGIEYLVKTITQKQIILVSGNIRVPIQIHKTCYYGNNIVNNFFRSIESDLVLDSINKYNPLHDISDSTKLFSIYHI
jgi:hypothetical protein